MRITSLLFVLILSGQLFAAPLKVCCSVPDLSDLAKIIGGNQVEVSTFVQGQEDPHALVAKPSDVLKLSKADAFIVMGMDMEVGWAPALVDRSRNASLRVGRPGHIDTGEVVIEPIHDAPSNVITRAMGDVHPSGNPHYLLDPVLGLKVAEFLSEKFSALSPKNRAYFKSQYENFKQLWGKKAFGKTLSEKYPVDQLIQIQELGKLDAFLKKTGETKALQGWFGKMSKIKGATLVADHSQWPYFAKRFGINIDRSLEPKPGVPPGSKFLQNLVEWMKAENIPGVLASPYFSTRFLDFVEKNSGAKILATAHQVQARPEAGTYLSMIDHNVQLIFECCTKAK